MRLVSGVGALDSQLKACGIEWLEGICARSASASLRSGSRPSRRRRLSRWPQTTGELRQTIARLGDAGLDSIVSNDAASLGAASLGNRIARPPCSLDKWLAVHRAAHSLGMRTVATMIFGTGKAQEQRVAFLEAVRQLQQETGGFTAFIPRGLPSHNTAGLWDGPTAVEQLKTLAIARVFLDNIQNIQ